MAFIEIKNLHFTYADGTNALKGVNLKIEKNQTILIIGKNGSGKTTLLLHLNGILIGRGEVLIEEKEVRKNIKEIRKKVGIVFQNPDDQIFFPTVYDDVAFGLMNLNLSKEEVEKRVNNSLELVKLNGFEERIVHHLSYGEKKRVAIAGVISMKPEILIFDEPTLGLDPWIKKDFIELIKKLKEEHTLIIASNDFDLINLVEKIFLMEDGKIREINREEIEEIIKETKI